VNIRDLGIHVLEKLYKIVIKEVKQNGDLQKTIHLPLYLMKEFTHHIKKIILKIGLEFI